MTVNGWDIFYPTCESYESLSSEQQQMVDELAVDYISNWTGGKFGLREVTVRPCREHSEGALRPSTFRGRGPRAGGGGMWMPVIIDGRWLNIGCWGCGTNEMCGCDYVAALRLPGPIGGITEVLIDGVVFDPAEYRVDSGRYLVRTDGEGWPTTQNMQDPTTEVGTWSVTYTRGVEVPSGGRVAAGLLSCEFSKAIVKDQSCALPQRIQTITRQGVTVAMLDSFDDIDKGHTE